MASDLLNFGIQGQGRIERVIQALSDGLDTQRILDEGSAIIFNNIRTRFLAQTDPRGQQWPVSGAALWREAHGIGGGTLYDSGRLFRSLQLYSESPDSRAIGTDVPYAEFHQWGTIHLPQRQFLGASDEDVRTFQALAILRISEALG